jgi:hypothetical protein
LSKRFPDKMYKIVGEKITCALVDDLASPTNKRHVKCLVVEVAATTYKMFDPDRKVSDSDSEFSKGLLTKLYSGG